MSLIKKLKNWLNDEPEDNKSFDQKHYEFLKLKEQTAIEKQELKEKIKAAEKDLLEARAESVNDKRIIANLTRKTGGKPQDEEDEGEEE